MDNLNKYIDHTQLKPYASEADIDQLLREAKEFSFASACVATCWVAKARQALKDTGVAVCTIAGFPLGSHDSAVKAFEAENAVHQGADEIDMVINIGFLKSGLYDLVQRDMEGVVRAAKTRIVKVILETCDLTDDEIVKGCERAMAAGAHFVKTSTGFGKAGADLHAVKLMKSVVGEKMLVKASGGIRDQETAIQMIEAGANRIGTSAGPLIIQGKAAAPLCTY